MVYWGALVDEPPWKTARVLLEEIKVRGRLDTCVDPLYGLHSGSEGSKKPIFFYASVVSPRSKAAEIFQVVQGLIHSGDSEKVGVTPVLGEISWQQGCPLHPTPNHDNGPPELNGERPSLHQQLTPLTRPDREKPETEPKFNSSLIKTCSIH